MNLSVVFLKSAEQDLIELKSYLVKNFGEASWPSSYKGIKKSFGMQEKYPLRGKIPEELENLNLTQYRQVISGMNRIIYQVRQEIVFIHILCDVRKDMRS
jgi:toxin ParE1/3/4